MEFVAVGRLMRAHGIHGDILCMPLSHSVERHSLLKRVFIETANGTKEAIISDSEEYNGVWKLHFEDLNSPEAVKPFVNAHILVPESERLPLPEGQYYFSDFENFKAIDKDGNEIGEVLKAQEMPSVNVFNILLKNKEIVVPWIDDCVLNVDMENKKITVNLEYVQGLL